MATSKPSAPKPAIKVVCATPGFRRGGHAFGPEPTVIAIGDLTKQQLAAIRAEPLLVVVDTEITDEVAAT
jgi:uncharacterized protein (UPF0218 family)